MCVYICVIPKSVFDQATSPLIKAGFMNSQIKFQQKVLFPQVFFPQILSYIYLLIVLIWTLKISCFNYLQTGH